LGFVIQRPDGQWYVAMKPNYGTAWTTDVREAAIFKTEAEAERVRKWNAEYVKEDGVVTWECPQSRDAKICEMKP
jgi:hypothetical protein